MLGWRNCTDRMRLIRLVPLLTYFPPHLAPPKPVNVSLVNVSCLVTTLMTLVTTLMEIMMVMTLLTMALSVVIVTGSQGTGPRLLPLSASLDNDNNHYHDGNYGNLSLVKNIQ